MNIEDRIKVLVGGSLNFNPKDIQRYSELRGSLKADSLDMLELIKTIEQHFDIEVDDKDIEHIATVGDIIDYVLEHDGKHN